MWHRQCDNQPRVNQQTCKEKDGYDSFSPASSTDLTPSQCAEMWCRHSILHACINLIPETQICTTVDEEPKWLMALAFLLSLEKFLQFSNACWMGTSTLCVAVLALAPLAATAAASYSFNTVHRNEISESSLNRFCKQQCCCLSSATEKTDHTGEDMFIISQAETGPGLGPASKVRWMT